MQMPFARPLVSGTATPARMPPCRSLHLGTAA